MRDLCPLPSSGPSTSELLPGRLLGTAAAETGEATAATWLYHRGFLPRTGSKQRLRGARARLKTCSLPRSAHAHIPEAPAGRLGCGTGRSGTGSRTSRTSTPAGSDKLRVRLADARAHAGEAAVVAASAAAHPLAATASSPRSLPAAAGAPGPGSGIALRPWPETPEALLAAGRRARGAARCCCGSIPGRSDHDAEEELARELHGRGVELDLRAAAEPRPGARSGALAQAAVEEIAPRFRPTAGASRSARRSTAASGGSGTCDEYVGARAARPRRSCAVSPSVEILGPAVIDFEYHVTAAVLNLTARRPALRRRLGAALRRPPRRPGEPPGRFRHRRQGASSSRRSPDTARNPTGRLLDHRGQLAAARRSALARRPAPSRWTKRRRPTTWSATTCWPSAPALVERVFWWQLIAPGLRPGGPPPRRPPPPPGLPCSQDTGERARRNHPGTNPAGPATRPPLPLPTPRRNGAGRRLERARRSRGRPPPPGPPSPGPRRRIAASPRQHQGAAGAVDAVFRSGVAVLTLV